MRIAVVFGNNGSDPRIIRTCRSLIKLGHEVHFVGWDRNATTPTDVGGAQSNVMSHGTRYGNSTLGTQWRFTWYVARQLARIRPDVVCAINEENAVRLLPWRGLFYRRLVCDVLDSHRDVGSARALFIRLILSFFTEIARIGSHTLIATDAARFQLFGRHQHKTKIIGNYPEDPGEGLSTRWPTGDVRLYVSGTLIEARGLRHLLTSIKDLDRVTIVVAGWPSDKYAQETFIHHRKVVYLGSVPLHKSLELAAECDAIFAFYEPNCRNNILASPNKLYEAMSVGRPVIINAESQVSQWVVAHSLGLTCNYADTDGLKSILETLSHRRAELPEFARHARHLFQQAYSWEKMEEVLEEIYGRGPLEPQRGLRREAA